MLAGHVVIGDNVSSSMGGVGIHHFVTVGEYAYLWPATHRIHQRCPAVS